MPELTTRVRWCEPPTDRKFATAGRKLNSAYRFPAKSTQLENAEQHCETGTETIIAIAAGPVVELLGIDPFRFQTITASARDLRAATG